MHELMGKSLKNNHRFTYILWFLQLIGPMFYDPDYLKGVMLGVIQGPGTNKILTNPSRVEGPIFWWYPVPPTGWHPGVFLVPKKKKDVIWITCEMLGSEGWWYSINIF